jgi:DNA-binding beta-propeller fold protein YncE
MLVLSGCVWSPEPTVVAKPARAARLVLATQTPGRGPTLVRPIDPNTLADAPGLEPLETPACSTRLVTQPGGDLAAVVSGLSGTQRCDTADAATLRVLDLNAWQWRAPVPLTSSTDAPLAWTADGHGLYVVTSTPPPEQRRLWLIDTNGTAPPISVPLDFVPSRLDVAPNAAAVFVLGGQTAGNARDGAAVQGSAFVAIFDPKTLSERIRVPLSGLNLGLADQPQGSLTPGVAVAPDGSRYYVVHADRPVLDVVDTRAPRLERLERSVSLRDAIAQVGTRRAWLGISPDGASLYAWHQAETPADDLGLQVIDTRKWQVQTIDPIAQRLSVSLNGRGLFELDPPAWTRPGAAAPPQRGPRTLSGARLSVLDPATHAEIATLMRDQFLYGAGQYGPDRLYLTEASLRQGRGPQPAALVGYDTATWQEIARRTLDSPGSLLTTSPLW